MTLVPPLGGAPARLAPNLADYEQACAAFSWEEARRQLAGLPDGKGLNIAYESEPGARVSR